MAFKMKGFSGFKDSQNDKNAKGVRPSTPKTTTKNWYGKPKTNNRPKFQGTDQNKSIVQQAPSQFQKDLKKIAKKTFDSNPVVQGVKVLKKFGKKTGLTKDIKKKSKKVKNYFGYYN